MVPDLFRGLSRNVRLGALVLIALGATWSSSAQAQQLASLDPERFEAAEIGDFELRFSPGESGLSRGDAITVDFPKAWFAEPFPFVKDVQTSDAGAPHFAFVRVESSRGKARKVKGELEILRTSERGEWERFRHRLYLKIDGGRVRADDTVVVGLHQTTAPVVAGSDVVVVTLETADSAPKTLHFAYDVVAGPAAKVRVVAASEALVGRESQLRVVLLDELDNPIDALRRPVTLSVTGLGTGALQADLESSARGQAQLNWRPRRPGMLVPAVTAQIRGGGDAADQPLTAIGGPVRVLHRQRTAPGVLGPTSTVIHASARTGSATGTSNTRATSRVSTSLPPPNTPATTVRASASRPAWESCRTSGRPFASASGSMTSQDVS